MGLDRPKGDCFDTGFIAIARTNLTVPVYNNLECNAMAIMGLCQQYWSRKVSGNRRLNYRACPSLFFPFPTGSNSWPFRKPPCGEVMCCTLALGTKISVLPFPLSINLKTWRFVIQPMAHNGESSLGMARFHFGSDVPVNCTIFRQLKLSHELRQNNPLSWPKISSWGTFSIIFPLVMSFFPVRSLSLVTPAFHWMSPLLDY